jgi:hypothetical protein
MTPNVVKLLAGIIKPGKVKQHYTEDLTDRRIPGRAQRNGVAKIVENYGSLYRLTDAGYRRLLTLVAAGKEYDLWELGAHIGCIHASTTNFDKDDAEFELSRIFIGSGSQARFINDSGA